MESPDSDDGGSSRSSLEDPFADKNTILEDTNPSGGSWRKLTGEYLNRYLEAREQAINKHLPIMIEGQAGRLDPDDKFLATKQSRPEFLAIGNLVSSIILSTFELEVDLPSDLHDTLRAVWTEEKEEKNGGNYTSFSVCIKVDAYEARDGHATVQAFESDKVKAFTLLSLVSISVSSCAHGPNHLRRLFPIFRQWKHMRICLLPNATIPDRLGAMIPQLGGVVRKLAKAQALKTILLFQWTLALWMAESSPPLGPPKILLVISRNSAWTVPPSMTQKHPAIPLNNFAEPSDLIQ
jgi:hypothetical protein